MKLMTKAIEKAPQKQYPLGADMNQKVVAKFFDPAGSYTWYLMNQDPNDLMYCWGIVKGNFVEVGSFNLGDLISYRGAWGLGIERDRYFEPMSAKEVFDKLNKGVHV